MNLEQIKSELRLFKSYTDDKSLFVGSVNQKALESGLLIQDPVSEDVLNSAIELYGIKPEEWNQTFHKSFQTVIDTPIEVLVAQQLIHYFTTYGLEAMDLYNQDLVYIPHEKLEVPDLDEDVKLIPIVKLTELELGNRLLELLKSGIALSKQTVEDVMMLSDYIDKERFDEINNKEVKIALYNKYGIVPKNNMDFLRYLVYKLSGSTMLIKSKELLGVLSDCDKEEALRLLKAYVQKPYGYKKLGEIFLSQNEFFVAIKSHNPKTKIDKELNHIINRAKKSARTNRKHMPFDVLDRLTSIYNMNSEKGEFYYNRYFKYNADAAGLTQDTISFNDIKSKLDTITVFREVRILNSIRYRLNDVDTAMYKIRNGKAYLENIEHAGKSSNNKFKAQLYLKNIIEEHLYNRIHNIIGNKTIYLPDNVEYTVPTSEKQFLGNFPIGTTITIPRNNNMVIGVHWKNLDTQRVDLDLHAEGENEHIGWNASYRSDDIVHSGDMTDAKLPDGATECLLIKSSLKEATFVIKLKNYTQNNHDVPYEFIIASTIDENVSKNYTINPNDIITSISTKFDYDPKYKTIPDIDIAYVTLNEDRVVLRFNNFSTDTSIAGFKEDVKKMAISYGEEYPKAQLTLRELLTEASCIIADKPCTEIMEEVVVETETGSETLYRKVEKKVDYDLSIESITKDMLITMFMEA